MRRTSCENFNQTIRNERQFKVFTGLPQKVFNRLLPPFTQCLESARQQRYEKHRGQRRRNRAAVVKALYRHRKSSSFLSCSI